MAALTWYATNNLASVHQEMSETDPGTEAYASPVTGWVVSTGGTNHAAFDSQVEVAASAFVDAAPPDGSIDTTNGDCLRSATTYSGDFASANWNVHFACRANNNGGAQDGRMRCRLFRSANVDGSGATEITGAQQQGGLVTNLATSATQVSTATFNPGAFTVNAEYIFIQLAWERTGAGGMSTSDVNMRIGNGSGTGTRVISSNFTVASPTGSASAAMSSFGVAAAGLLEFIGSASAAMQSFAVSAAGLLEFIGSASAAIQSFAVSATGTVTAPSPVGSASAAVSQFAVSAAGIFTAAAGAGSYAHVPGHAPEPGWPATGQYQSIGGGSSWPVPTQYDDEPDEV